MSAVRMSLISIYLQRKFIYERKIESNPNEIEKYHKFLIIVFVDQIIDVGGE